MVKREDHNCPVSASAVDDASAANDRGDLAALEAFLQAGEASQTQIRFACGTMQPDGRLDMCKQSLGSSGLFRLKKTLSASSLVKHILLGTNWLMSEGARTVGDIIARNASLETVYLGCNAIESTGVEYLCHGLMQNSSVNALWLKRNPIGAEGAKLIATLLEKRGGIAVLDLVNTDIGPGLPRLVEALISPAGSAVRYLYLGENGLTVQHAGALAELIEHGSLKGLYLNANGLGDAGVHLLVPALRRNQGLEILALASNNLTAASAAAIKEGGLGSVKVLELGVAQSAKVVGAQPNLLRDEGARQMAEFFMANNHLIECGMAGNQIGDVGARNILEALEGNHTLERLVPGNTVSKRLRVEIYERLRVNNPTNRSATSLNPYSRHVQSVYR